VSRALGIGIITVSGIIKVPQIIKLVSSHSAEGLSFLSYLLEISGHLITLAYNVRRGYPFGTFGEIALISVQNAVIASLVLHYSGKSAAAGAFIAALATAVYALFNEGIVDDITLNYLQAGAGGLAVASKLPQILAIFQQGGTGQLSAFAVFNYLFGSLARVFTTFQEVDDKTLLYSIIAAASLNAILAGQMIYYWNSPASKSAPIEKKAKGKAKQAKEIALGSTTGTSPSKSKTPTTRRRG